MASETITSAGVLIIDPQANMAALVAGMLRSLGRRDIREVTDTGQALSALQRRPFDIIIIDDAITSPNAVELVRRLRANADSPNRLTPVIMLSAAPDASRIAAARDAGVTEFLRKPFAAAHLKLRLDTIADSPRPFIEADRYAGPDRRRKTIAVGKADRRQAKDHPNGEAATPAEAGASAKS